MLGLAGNHEQKMFQIEQKMCKGTRNVHKGFCGIIEWPCVALNGLVRPFLPCMASHGLTLSYMAFYGNLAVIDPNSFGLVQFDLDKINDHHVFKAGEVFIMAMIRWI